MISKKRKSKIKSIACCAAMLAVMGAMAVPSFAGSATANLTYDAKIAYAGETGFSTGYASLEGNVSNVSKHTVLVRPKYKYGSIWTTKITERFTKSDRDQPIKGYYHPTKNASWTVELEPGGPNYKECIATATIKN